MGSYDPICYTYEADHHCPDCAEKRFGRCKDHQQIACCAEDSEGNAPGPVSPWEEWMNIGDGNQTLSCGDCGCVIEEYTEDDEEMEEEDNT